VNSTGGAAVCRIWAIDGTGSASLAYPVPVEIEAFSVKDAEIAIFPSDYRSFEGAVAEVVGEDLHCVVEASAPVTKKTYALPSMLAASGLASALVAAAVLACVLSLPRISAFAAPPTAMTGTTIDAQYRASGLGTLAYVVQAPDGRHTQQGVLTDRSGSIPVALSPSNSPGAYTLRLTMRGAFSTDQAVRVVNAVPPKVVDAGARIAGISVTPVVAAAGAIVSIAYGAIGDHGFIRLLDADGTVWAQKAFSRRGRTTLVVPSVTSSREMRVLLHVSRGQSSAESSAGLLVIAAPAAQAASDDASANGTFQLARSTVNSGGTIAVAIISPRNGMRVSLMDTQSHELSGVDVGSDTQKVTLHAPVVQRATRFVVQTSFVDGFGQESIVEPVTVEP
jgi:hypothetical protein